MDSFKDKVDSWGDAYRDKMDEAQKRAEENPDWWEEQRKLLEGRIPSA